MRNALIAVGAIALLALGVGLGALRADDSGDHQRFTLVAHEAEAAVTPSTFFTDPPKQNAAGSEDAPLYRDDKKVGLAETAYTVLRTAGGDTDVMVECDIELPEGHLLFNGAAHLADVAKGAVVPVVGGSGKYRGATGQVTMVGAADGSTTTLRFDITVP